MSAAITIFGQFSSFGILLSFLVYVAVWMHKTIEVMKFQPLKHPCGPADKFSPMDIYVFTILNWRNEITKRDVISRAIRSYQLVDVHSPPLRHIGLPPTFSRSTFNMRFDGGFRLPARTSVPFFEHRKYLTRQVPCPSWVILEFNYGLCLRSTVELRLLRHFLSRAIIHDAVG